MAGDDVELEIDDLPNDVQHKLLKYIHSIFPPAHSDGLVEEMAVDEEYEPADRTGKIKKRHKPMKKHEQENRIAQLSAKVEAMKAGVSGTNSSSIGGGVGAEYESSDDEKSESSEEE